jgi:hypothetical protein
MTVTPMIRSKMPSPIFERCCDQAVERRSFHGRIGFSSRPSGTTSIAATSLI